MSIKVTQHIIVEYLHINIGNTNSSTRFLDILYYTTIIYEDSAIGFRPLNRVTAEMLYISARQAGILEYFSYFSGP